MQVFCIIIHTVLLDITIRLITGIPTTAIIGFKLRVHNNIVLDYSIFRHATLRDARVLVSYYKAVKT